MNGLEKDQHDTRQHPRPAPRDAQRSKALLDGWGFVWRMAISWNHIRLFSIEHLVGAERVAVLARLTRASHNHAITIETLTISSVNIDSLIDDCTWDNIIKDILNLNPVVKRRKKLFCIVIYWNDKLRNKKNIKKNPHRYGTMSIQWLLVSFVAK